MANKTGRLVYVVGPSGAGKDALLEYARAHLPHGAKVKFAPRWITRPADAGGERHLPLTQAEFEQRVKAGRFAMHWRAHGNGDRKSTRLNSSHIQKSRMPSSA